MKDPTDEILTAFYTALNGNLAYGDVDYPVYTIPPKDAEYNYVLMDDVNLMDASCKDIYGTEGTILFDVVSGGFKNRATLKAVNDVSNDLLQLVIRNGLTMTGFSFAVRPYLDSVNILKEETDTSIIVRKLIRLRFFIRES